MDRLKMIKAAAEKARVTPFEDEVRHITWQADDLEYEIEEAENGND